MSSGYPSMDQIASSAVLTADHHIMDEHGEIRIQLTPIRLFPREIIIKKESGEPLSFFYTGKNRLLLLDHILEEVAYAV